jgi:hypothetical protein
MSKAMMNVIKELIKDEDNRFLYLENIDCGIIAFSLYWPFSFWLLKHGAFIECFYKSSWLMSLAMICHRGNSKFFSALGNNHWRIKYANKDYQIYKAIILILINVIIFLLTGPKRSYVFFIVPIILWGMLIVIEGIERFFKS